MKVSLKALLVVGGLSVCALPVKAVEVLGVVDEPLPPFYGRELLQANELNDLLMQLSVARETQQQVKEAREELGYQQKRIAQMDACNVKELSKYFVNAPEVWDKLKQSMDTQTRDLALDFNASEPVNPNGSDEQTLAEVLVSWRLGRDTLMDLYAHPEKYGTLKPGASFPLWEDQKYVYERQLADTYAQINTHFGVAADGMPSFGDTYKASDVQQAHDAYLADLAQKFPEKARDMPAALKQALLPPQALPPADEIVQYVGDVSQTHQVYPEWPAPWQEFIKSGFTMYNLTGEMAADFVPKTFHLNEAATVGNRAMRDNRLNQYQTALISLDASKKVLTAHEQTQKEMTDYVVNKLAQYDLKPEDTDWVDETKYADLANRVKALKQERLTSVKAKIAENLNAEINWEDDQTVKLAAMQPGAQDLVLKRLPRGSAEYKKANDIIRASKIKKDAALVAALEKDVDGVVPLSQFNAAQVDQLINEHAAQKALADEIKKEQLKNQDRFRERELKTACPFDDMGDE